MPQTYVILFTSSELRDTFVKKFEEHRPQDDWFYYFPNSVFVTTDLTSRQITDLVEKILGSTRHVVSRVTKDTWGRSLESMWKRTKPYPEGS